MGASYPTPAMQTQVDEHAQLREILLLIEPTSAEAREELLEKYRHNRKRTVSEKAP